MFVERWKYPAVALLVLALGVSPGWARKKRGAKKPKTDGCKEAEQIIKLTDEAKKKAKEHNEQSKARETAQAKQTAALGKEKEAQTAKDAADKQLAEDKKKSDATSKALDAHLKKVTEVEDAMRAEQAKPQTDATGKATAAASQAQAKKAELDQLNAKTDGLAKANSEAFGKFKESDKAAEAAKKTHDEAAKALADAKKAYKEEKDKEDKAAKTRIKDTNKLLEEHHHLGHTAMRCPKYQLTGAGAALWQKSSTGRGTLKKALDKQMDLFANTGSQTRDERVKDAQDLALGGFENQSGSAKKFRKTIEKRIKETTDERDETVAQQFKGAREFRQDRIDRLKGQLADLEVEYQDASKAWRNCLKAEGGCSDKDEIIRRRSAANEAVKAKQVEIAKDQDYLDNKLKKGEW